MTSVPQQPPLPIFARKVCMACGGEKEESEYYVKYRGTNKLYPRCKRCHYEHAHAPFRSPPGSHPLPAYRVCTMCGITKWIDEFPSRGGQGAGYRSRCRQCHRAENAEYRAAHRAELQAAARSYYEAHKDACLDRTKAAIAANPEKYQAMHRTWKAANKDAVNASTHKRRATLRGDGNSWTAEEWEALKRAFDYRCLLCGKREPDIALCFDHVVPVSLGGPNTIANAQPMCRRCNSKKHRKILDLRKGISA